MNKIILVAGALNPINSYEYHNIFKPLEKMGYIVKGFDFIARLKAIGREKMNQEMLAFIKFEQPQLVIFVPHTDQFIPEIIDEINQYAITLGYLFDDTWRIEYSRFWARHFNFVTTSDINGLSKFREAGFENVLYSPFACNTDVYYKKNLPKKYDVTFIGQYHPHRDWHIQYIKKARIDVQVWGAGWPSSTLSTEDMINIFNQSRVNLNLSNCVSWDFRYLASPFRPIKSTLRVWRQTIRSITRQDIKKWEMVKGRHFEINACGVFQLSYYVEGLERLYAIGEEIAVFVSPEDLVEKIRYYLKHDEERENIASRGYERTHSDHSMAKRLRDILEKMNLA